MRSTVLILAAIVIALFLVDALYPQFMYIAGVLGCTVFVGWMVLRTRSEERGDAGFTSGADIGGSNGHACSSGDSSGDAGCSAGDGGGSGGH